MCVVLITIFYDRLKSQHREGCPRFAACLPQAGLNLGLGFDVAFGFNLIVINRIRFRADSSALS
jgi:hypothetical protein